MSLNKVINAFKLREHEPKLSHYPNWFRQFIEDPLQGCSYGLVGMVHQPTRMGRDPLQEIFTIMRIDPIANVSFNLAIDSVRMRFKLWDMQKRMNLLQEQIDELKKHNECPEEHI